jgi:hypothetical protein
MRPFTRSVGPGRWRLISSCLSVALLAFGCAEGTGAPSSSDGGADAGGASSVGGAGGDVGGGGDGGTSTGGGGDGGGSTGPCAGQPDGTYCGQPDAEACDLSQCAAGSCVTVFAPQGSPCGSPEETVCSLADSCDGDGSCSPNDLDAGTLCGDPDESECDHADACDGAGTCDDGVEPVNTPCGDASDTDCTNPDSCDGAGVCLDRHALDGAVCDDCPDGPGECDVCEAGVCLDACFPTAVGTTFTSNNGLAGNMFDVHAITDVELSSVEVNLDGGDHDVEIYFKVGTWEGAQNTAGSWTLVGSATVTSLGQDLPTDVPIDLALPVAAGDTVALYVTATTSAMNYTDGTAVGAIAASTAHLEILEGSGAAYPFGTNLAPRVWNGVLHYRACP